MTPLLLAVVALTSAFAVSTVIVVILIKRAPLVEEEYDRISPDPVARSPGAISSRANSPSRLLGRSVAGPAFYVSHVGQSGGGSQTRMPR